jgi:hypothetical protein
MRRCKAWLMQSLPVTETRKGATVWQGIVHAFKLSAHPRGESSLRLVIPNRGERQAATLCYAASTGMTEATHQASELNLIEFIKRHESTKRHLGGMFANLPSSGNLEPTGFRDPCV